eukprot:TRINITY_DN40030_c0_g1_i1.p1 TRINITY_DN40030_c0_g1~~TRINITY_DN40030_c0_g1_i1.p1  ORF type:complete len:170 (+),score=47.19 TRINITY_DN40030_c0_g1_i1:575-1084(+)
MPRYTTSQTFTDGNTQIVALPDIFDKKDNNPNVPPEQEDLDVKLQRITEQVPVRISNTSGSSAGSGSGDFHQYRQMRRHEQDRLMRMDVDFKRRKAITDFEARRLERVKAVEEKTARKRAKRQKKKEKKKNAKAVGGTATEEGGKESGDDGRSEEGEEEEDAPVQAPLD